MLDEMIEMKFSMNKIKSQGKYVFKHKQANISFKILCNKNSLPPLITKSHIWDNPFLRPAQDVFFFGNTLLKEWEKSIKLSTIHTF